MAKSKAHKRVVKILRNCNKELEQDVFGNRFWMRLAQEQKNDGVEYFLFELKDREQPERDSIADCHWVYGNSAFIRYDIFKEMNDFIIESDFWTKYWKAKDGRETPLPEDSYKSEFAHYKLNKK